MSRKSLVFLSLFYAMALLPFSTFAQEEAKEPATDQSAQEAIEEAKETTNDAIEAAKQAVLEAIERAKDAATSVLESEKEVTQRALDKANEATRTLDKASEAMREVLEKAKQATGEVFDKAKEAAQSSTEVAQQEAAEADELITVNVDNFARAETDMQIGRMLEATKGVNKWNHNRLPTPLDKQNVIRMNRDTLYSFALVDISKGATVTLPDVGDRYLSLMVINNDGYINKVFHGGGTHELTLGEFDTPYVILAARMLVNSADDADIKAANELQDQMKIDAVSEKPFVMPNYEMESYKATYQPLLELAKGVPDTKRMFGSKEDVDPVRFLIGSAFGWGGLPAEEAYYLNVNPELPVGEYQITAKNVPVDAFWSISVYNKDGYFEKNDLGVYSVNNISGKPNEDGSLTVHLGGCDDGRINCIPLTEGWNYTVRLYEPRPEILDGTWTFPSPKPVEK